MSLILRILRRIFSRAAPPPQKLAEDPFEDGFNFIMGGERDGQFNDSAPGETFPTHWGIVPETYQAAVAHGIKLPPFDQLTRDAAESIYRVQYWNAMGCQQLHRAVAFVMFCDATLTGVGNVVHLAQRISGNPHQDGAAGPETWAHINKMDPQKFVQSFITADREYLASLASAPKYINGWTRRETETETAALRMIS